MNGKGSKPRNCFSARFREGYDRINWHRPFPTADEASNLWRKYIDVAEKIVIDAVMKGPKANPLLPRKALRARMAIELALSKKGAKAK